MVKKEKKPLLADRGSWLIVGEPTEFIAKSKKILAPLKVKFDNNPNLLVLKEDPPLIADAKKIKSFFTRKSFGRQPKIVFICCADQMSFEVQNALLKTIEELRQREYVFLGIRNISRLLPTIISRCQLLLSPPKFSDESRLNLESAAGLPLAERLFFLETNYETKKMTAALLQEKLRATIVYYQQQMLRANPQQITTIKQRIITCLTALRMIDANLKPLFVVDWLGLNL